jgi:hypothetical protein
LVIACNRDRCGGEGAGHDGFFEDTEGAGETAVLVVESGYRFGTGQKACLVVGMTCPVIAKSVGGVKETGRGTDGTFGCEVSLRGGE